MFYAIVLSTVYFVIICWLEAKADSKKTVVRHKTKPYIRAVKLLPAAAALLWCYNGVALTVALLWQIPLVALMLVFVWWFLFDAIQNRYRNKPFWDNGSHDDVDNSVLDYILSRLPDRGEAVLKIGLAAISIVTYALTL